MSYLYIETNYPTACMFEKFLSWWTIPDGGNLRLYFGLYNNATSGWQYFSGNVTHGLSTGSKLVNRGSSESSAQSSYLAANDLLDSNDRLVCILPQVSVAKKVRIYVESGHQVVLKHWIAGERLNAGEIVTGNITMTDQYKSPPKITVVASANEYLKVGKLNATDFGIKGFDGNANRVFEISDADLMLGGKWDLTGSLLASSLTIEGHVSKITSGTGDHVAVYDGADALYRIYVGNATPNGASFKVDKYGRAYITKGEVTASIIVGENYVTATSLSASSVDNVAIAGGVIRDAHLGSGDFTFDSKVTVAGKVIPNGGVWLPDNQGINFATASSAEITHTGSHLQIDNSDGKIKINTGPVLASALEIDETQNTKFFGSVNSQAHFVTGNLTLDSNEITNAASDLTVTVGGFTAMKAISASTLVLYHKGVEVARTTPAGMDIIAGNGEIRVSGVADTSRIKNTVGTFYLTNSGGELNLQASTGFDINVNSEVVGPATLPQREGVLANKKYVDHAASIVESKSDMWLFGNATPIESIREGNNADWYLNASDGDVWRWYDTVTEVTDITSVIFDVANNWGDANYTNVRGINFYQDGGLIEVNASSASTYQTTVSTPFDVEYVFDTDLSATGTSALKSWQSDTGASRLSNRLIVVFNEPKTFNRIRVFNGHDNASDVDSGAKDVKIWVTTATVVDTTYEATFTDSTNIYNGVFDIYNASTVTTTGVPTWNGTVNSNLYNADITTVGNATGNELATQLGAAYNGDLTTNDPSGAWYAYDSGYQTTGWTGQDFNATVTVARYRIYSSNYTLAPASWKFEGSNTGSFGGEETVLDINASYTWPSSEFSWRNHDIGEPQAFRYYRVNVTLNNGNATYLAIQEIEMVTASPLGGYDRGWLNIYSPGTTSGSGLNEWHEDANGNLIPNALGQDIGTLATPVRSMYLSASTLYIAGKDINASQQDHTRRIVYLEASVANLTTSVNNLEASTFELTANSVNATHIKAGALTSGDLRDEDFRFTQDIIVTSNASISGNIAVGGTVDGVDIANLEASVQAHTTAINALPDLTASVHDNTSRISANETSITNAEASIAAHTPRIVYLEASVADLTTAINAVDESSWQASVHDNTSRIVYLEASVAANTTAINNIDEGSWQASVHDNTSRITNAEASIAAHTPRIVYLEASVADLTIAINAVDESSWQASVHDNTSRIIYLEASVAANTTAINNIDEGSWQASVHDNTSRITSAEASIAANTTAINNIVTTNWQASVHDNTSRISANETSITNAEASIANHTTRIVYLEASVAANTTAINNIDEGSWQASVHDNTSRISANETSITNAEASIANHTPRINYLEASVADLTTAINAVDESSWQASVHDNTSRISANETSITNAEASISNHTTRIVYLEASVADVNTRINNLEASTFELTANSVGNTEIKNASDFTMQTLTATTLTAKGELRVNNATDLVMYNDGSTYIVGGTGNTFLRSDGTGAGAYMDAKGSIYFRTGNSFTTAMTINSIQNITLAADIYFTDGQRSYYGSSSDAYIYHNGTVGFFMSNTDGVLSITNSGAADLSITQTNADGKLYLKTGSYVVAMSVNASQLVEFVNHPKGPSSAPTLNYELANKKYVDDNIVDNSASVIDHTSRIVYLEASVADLTTAVNAVDEYTWAASVHDNTARITSAEASITNHTGRIVYLEASVADLTTAVNNLSASSTDLSASYYSKWTYNASVPDTRPYEADFHLRTTNGAVYAYEGSDAASPISARSIILDIADNHGDNEFVGLRSMEFYYLGSLIDISATNIVCYETTKYDTTRWAEYVFTTGLSKTGGAANTSWLSDSNDEANQRIICNFNATRTFDAIVINNEHASNTTGAGHTDRGVNNVVIRMSTNTISDTTYNATVANSVVLYDGTFEKHAVSDTEQDETVYDISAGEWINIYTPSASIDLTATVHDNTSRIVYLEASVADNTTAINNAEASIANHTSRIVYLEASVAANTTAINNAEASIANHTPRIVYLEASVSDLTVAVNSINVSTELSASYYSLWNHSASVPTTRPYDQDYHLRTSNGAVYTYEGTGTYDPVSAKSIVLDIADNHGDGSYTAIRSMEFWHQGNLIDVVATNIDCYESTKYGTSRWARFVFITALPKIGGASNNAWMSAENNETNQRLICNFNATQTFDKIVINNGHATNSVGGIETDRGINNVVIRMSPTHTTSDTTYNATFTNATILFDGTFTQHVASDKIDNETIWDQSGAGWVNIYTPSAGLSDWHEDASGHLIPNALGQDIGTTATPVRSMYLSASTLYIGGKDINASVKNHTGRIVYLEASVANLTTAVNAIDESSWQASVHDNTSRITSAEASITDHSGRIVALEASIGGGGGLENWTEDGNTLHPTTVGAAIGNTTYSVGDITMARSDLIFYYSGSTIGTIGHDGTHMYLKNWTGGGDVDIGQFNAANTGTIDFYIKNNRKWRIDNDGKLVTPHAEYDVGLITARIGTVYAAGLDVSGNISNTEGSLTLENTTATSLYIDNKNAVGSIYLRTGATPTTAVTVNASQITYFASHPKGPSSAPTLDYQLANKKYVDDEVSGASGGLTAWEENGSTLRPKAAGYDLGDTTHELGKIYQGDGSIHHFGDDQDFQMYFSGSLAQIRNTTGALYIENQNDTDSIFFRTGATLVEALRIDGNQNVTIGSDLFIPDNQYIHFGDQKDGSLRWQTSVSMLRLETKSTTDQESLYLQNLSTHASGEVAITNLGGNSITIAQKNASGGIYLQTGTTPTNAFYVDANQDAQFGGSAQWWDAERAYFGDGKDMDIYFSGAAGVITCDTGYLEILSNATGGLYLDNNASPGFVDIRTGDPLSSGLKITQDQDATFGRDVYIPTDGTFYIGDSNEFSFYTLSTWSYLSAYGSNGLNVLVSGSSGMYFSAQDATGQIHFRTGTAPTTAVIIDEDQEVNLPKTDQFIHFGADGKSKIGSSASQSPNYRWGGDYTAYIGPTGVMTATPIKATAVSYAVMASLTATSYDVTTALTLNNQTGNLLPHLENDLGSDTYKWGGGYFTNLYVDDELEVDLIGAVTGQQLAIGAGETDAQFTTTNTGTTEFLWLGGESGVKVVSSPDNWSSSWAGRYETTLISTAGTMSLAGALIVGSCGQINSGSSPSGTTAMEYNGYFYATRVYNAVYNDIADYQKVDDIHKAGMAYRETRTGLKLCNERCQLGIVGIYSDTYGYGLGSTNSTDMAPIAVAGWVLAYVDKEYEPGTPLTNDENGKLTEITLEEKRNYPERIIATYKQHERSVEWGPADNRIDVNNRHWVKVK